MLWGHWVSLTCFSGPNSADSPPPSAGWVQIQSSSTLAWPETDWNNEAARSRSLWWGHCVSLLLPLSRRLWGSWSPAVERTADTARSCAWRRGGGGAGWPHTPQREMPQRRSPGTAQFRLHVLPQCPVLLHDGLPGLKSYRVVELDAADVILGQSDASVLRVDEQKPLREKGDFSWDGNLKNLSKIY